MTEKRLLTSTSHIGVRLDKVLADLLPDAGLRLRRRLCDEGVVTVNGRPAKASLKMREGMDVVVTPSEDVSPSPDDLGIYVVDIQDGLAAVYKPQGVHTASIAGRMNISVEAFLPQLFPVHEAVLLNRLDRPTSGLVAVALFPENRHRYQTAEDEGHIDKEYVALVQGCFEGKRVIRNALDMADRKKTRVLSQEDSDASRWTEVVAEAHDETVGITRVRCMIKKGARHQIRAHLGAAGHPILGDVVYGGSEAERIFLHHELLQVDDVVFQAPCPF